MKKIILYYIDPIIHPISDIIPLTGLSPGHMIPLRGTLRFTTVNQGHMLFTVQMGGQLNGEQADGDLNVR